MIYKITHKHFLIKFSYTIFSILVCTFGANATNIIVTNLNNNGSGSLRQAVVDAADHDTIRFNPNLISSGNDTIHLTSEITVNKGLTFVGIYNNTDTLFLSGENISRIFNINLDTAISKVLKIDSLAFIQGNVIGDGGAISFIYGDSLYIENSLVKNSSAHGNGGGLYAFNNSPIALSIKNSTITGNSIYPTVSSPQVYGGGIHVNSYGSSNVNHALIILNSSISNNFSDSRSGGIYTSATPSDNATAFIENSMINGNTALDGAGGVYFSFADSVTIKNSQITGNTSGSHSGGIYSSYSTIYVQDNSVISDNSAQSIGGGGYLRYSPIYFINSSLNNNSSANGGGIYTLSQDPMVTIDHSSVSENTSNSYGGGIYSVVITVGSSTNTNASYILVKNSTFKRNAAIYSGGGIYVKNLSGIDTINSIINIEYSTFAGNSAGTDGGAIYSNFSTSDTTLICNSFINVKNSTISYNSSGGVGNGIYSAATDSSVVKIKGSILALNGSNNIYNNDTIHTIHSQGYNIFESMPTGYSVNLDQVNIDSLALKLLPLANNGGTTETMALGYSSVAINTGDLNDITNAQNRPISGVREVGAAEVCYLTAITDVKTACDSLVWIDGNTYTTDNNTAVYTFSNGNSNDCDSVIVLDFSLVSSDLTVSSSTDSVLTANQSGVTYQWLDCNTGFTAILGATSQSYSALISGSYAVEITNGDCVDISECVSVEIVGVNELSSNFVKIYPNPVNDIFTITLPNEESVLIEIVDMQGKIVFPLATVSNMQSVTIKNFESGIYFVKLVADDYRMTKKMVKY